MLNFSNKQGEAKIHYGPADYMILESGNYVRCAVTGEKIILDELKYWNDDLQEAYVNAAASTKRWQESRS